MKPGTHIEMSAVVTTNRSNPTTRSLSNVAEMVKTASSTNPETLSATSVPASAASARPLAAKRTPDTANCEGDGPQTTRTHPLKLKVVSTRWDCEHSSTTPRDTIRTLT